MTAIYAPKSVLKGLFWHCNRGSIVILAGCLKSILGYTIYSGICGYFWDMYTIYCGVLVSVIQYDYLCILYSFVGCFCVCCIVGMFVDKLLFWYLFLWYGDVVWYMFCTDCMWVVESESGCIIDIVVLILKYLYCAGDDALVLC